MNVFYDGYFEHYSKLNTPSSWEDLLMRHQEGVLNSVLLETQLLLSSSCKPGRFGSSGSSHEKQQIFTDLHMQDLLLVNFMRVSFYLLISELCQKDV